MRKIGMPARIGMGLAALGVLSGIVVAAGLAGNAGLGFLTAAGEALTRPLGWAALCLPAYFFASATVLFLPGYRKDLLILLTGAPLPFLILVFLARFLSAPESWYGSYPILEALGLPGTAALGTLALLLSITLLARLKILLAGVRAEPRLSPEGSARPAFVPLVPALEEIESADPGDEPIPVLFGRVGDPERRPPLLGAVTADPSAEAEMRPSRGLAPEASATSPQGPDQAAGDATKATPARHVQPTFQSVPPAPRARRPPTTAYSLPTEILTVYPDGQYWVIDDKTRRSADVLRETLAEFNIEAEVTGIRRGPVVTMFEILPAPGVKLSRIATLSDNIALRLAASSVRIVAPIPGKHAVGIEVPNDRRSIVSFREIVETEVFRSAKPEIPIALGKDIAGEVQVIDLTQMPHLLIAGATGSGKSVCVNSIILSILYRQSWNEVKLLLIDPKIVELKLYNGVPHLLTPVVTEPKRAYQALQYCICEMERRYSLLDGAGVRDIKSYNRRIKEREYAAERLPYIVIVIDEFADLMATTGKELESTLARLAAMSRAVGLHLVLATQRPSIDVITGLIKANIPSRIAFMVASKFDSRIIIDSVGAEKLLGKGDMLVSTVQDAFPMRMQGAFVSEEEVERVVEHVKTLGEPDYIDDEMFYDEDEDDGNLSLFEDEDDDPLFEKALEIVLQQGKASASFLQRRLKIGYNRAARLVELMEEKGIVGPAQGSKARDVMRNPDVAGRPDAGRTPRDALGPGLGFANEAGRGLAGPDADADGEPER